jgi:peroxiredoxin Q/BCP
VDSREKNEKFAESLGIRFPILSDEDKTVSRAYGVLIPLIRLANRSTFMVDKKGVIRQIIKGSDAVDPAGALQACHALGRQ